MIPDFRSSRKSCRDRDVELVAEYADVLQIGARNMQNFSLLEDARQGSNGRSAEAGLEFDHEGAADVR